MDTELSEERRPSIWPWLFILVLNLLTLAPSGIGRLLYDFSGRWLSVHLAWFYWLGLLGLIVAGFVARKRSLRAVVLGAVVILLILNIGGCVSVLNELGSVT